MQRAMHLAVVLAFMDPEQQVQLPISPAQATMALNHLDRPASRGATPATPLLPLQTRPASALPPVPEESSSPGGLGVSREASAAPAADGPGGSSEAQQSEGVDPKSIVPKAPDLESMGVTEAEAEQAVVRIQAAFKGHKARKEVAAMRDQGAKLRQEMVVAAQAEAAAAQVAEGTEGAPKKQKPPPRTPRELEEFNDEDMKQIMKLQALQRGRIARKRVEKLKQKGGADANPAAPTAEVPLSFDITPEVEQKVIKIQALQRGRKARQQVVALKSGEEDASSAPSSSEPVSEIDLLMMDEETKKKIVRIQAVQRGRVARKQVAALRKGNLEQLHQFEDGPAPALSGAAMPTVEDAYPNLAPGMSPIQGEMPVPESASDEQAAAPAEESTPAPEEPLPVAEESAPAPEESAPAAEESAPAPEESAPAPEESAPAAEESAPAVAEASMQDLGGEPSIGEVLAAPAAATDLTVEASLGHALAQPADAEGAAAPVEAATAELNLAPPGAAEGEASEAAAE